MTIEKKINCQTGEVVERELTAEEENHRTNEQSAMATFKAEKEAEEQAKANNQASGNQKLLDLGLTQAEATALTGYTPPVEE